MGMGMHAGREGLVEDCEHESPERELAALDNQPDPPLEDDDVAGLSPRSSGADDDDEDRAHAAAANREAARNKASACFSHFWAVLFGSRLVFPPLSLFFSLQRGMHRVARRVRSAACQALAEQDAGTGKRGWFFPRLFCV